MANTTTPVQDAATINTVRGVKLIDNTDNTFSTNVNPSFSAPAVPGDNTTLPTTSMIAAVAMGYNGTTEDLIRIGTKTIDLSFTSPATSSTVAQTAITALGQYRSMFIYAALQGATGGTLDIYLQVSPDSGTTWVDYGHFAQLAAGAAQLFRVWTVSKQSQQTTLQTVGTGGSPALAVSTIIGGEFGDRIRVVSVAGAGTTAGAAQTIKAVLSN